MTGASKGVSPRTFFVLTYTLSWVIWIPLILASSLIPEGVSNIVRLFGVLMPAISAVILTAYVAGPGGVKQLLGRLKIRSERKWLLVVLIVYPVMLVTAGLLFNLYAPQSVNFLPFDVAVLFANMLMLSIAGLGEEIGWHGVALPALQKKHSPFISSLILGLLWAVWHLPFWLLIGTLSRFGAYYFALNFIFVIPMAIFISWVFNRTKGSILYPTLFHVAFNVVNVAVFPVTNSVGAFGVFIAIQSAVILLVIPALRKTTAAVI